MKQARRSLSFHFPQKKSRLPSGVFVPAFLFLLAAMPGRAVEIIKDNSDAAGVVITGAWTSSTSVAGYYGSNYIHDGNAGKGAKSVRYTPAIPTTGQYLVYARWTSNPDRAAAVPVAITHAGGTSNLSVSQQANGGSWYLLGTYTFNGNTTVSIVAPGFTSATAKCWQSGGTFGSDTTVATVSLSSGGEGIFTFPAGSYPHGPLTLRITGTNGTLSDTCYLQLYNSGGTVWNQGIPATPPPAAAGLSLVFSDDFNTMPSISGSGAGATYAAHKPGGGDFSGIPFADPTGEGNPFSQVDSYLRIRADATKNTTGLISSLRMDGTGFLAHCPAYFECRFIAPSAPGTWPAFWLLTYDGSSFSGVPVDELDIIEAYGGEGTSTPNAPRAYGINSHNWNQTGIPAGQKISKTVNMANVGGSAGWMYTPHVYGCLVTMTDTIYYLDNIEVGRHQTSPVSKTDGFWFMINLAVGGTSGWYKDLSRYNGVADMYVDYVRVYALP